MSRHLGPPVAGEHAFEVHRRRAHGALAGLEIGEVPHVHPCHERPPAGPAEHMDTVPFEHRAWMKAVLCYGSSNRVEPDRTTNTSHWASRITCSAILPSKI
jgi:hypothetical protein